MGFGSRLVHYVTAVILCCYGNAAYRKNNKPYCLKNIGHFLNNMAYYFYDIGTTFFDALFLSKKEVTVISFWVENPKHRARGK